MAVNFRDYLNMIQQMSAMGGGGGGHGGGLQMMFGGPPGDDDEDVESSSGSEQEESSSSGESKGQRNKKRVIPKKKQVMKKKVNIRSMLQKAMNDSDDQSQNQEETLVAPEGFDKHHVIYSYFNEMNTGSKRIVTVAYRRDIKTGYTHYGACIFRKEYPDESFVKATHKKTAFERLMKKPVIFQKTAETKADFLRDLRKMIHVCGVCSDWCSGNYKKYTNKIYK